MNGKLCHIYINLVHKTGVPNKNHILIMHKNTDLSSWAVTLFLWKIVLIREIDVTKGYDTGFGKGEAKEQ